MYVCMYVVFFVYWTWLRSPSSSTLHLSLEKGCNRLCLKLYQYVSFRLPEIGSVYTRVCMDERDSSFDSLGRYLRDCSFYSYCSRWIG